MKTRFWHQKRVLITGHTGFKGSWLCILLERLGAAVHGYALDPPTEPSLFGQAGLASRIASHKGDVRDFGHLQSVMKETAPEVIFHLAAQSVVSESYRDPVETYSTNVVGTACLLQAARELSHPCVIVSVTSDKCYRNREWTWGYRENDELGGHDPYSNSKACAELVTQSMRDSFFPIAEFGAHQVAIASARAGNVIGGGDWTANQLIPDIIRAATAGRSVAIRQPGSVRPWQHVLDCLHGYVVLAEKLADNGPEYSGPWNFGPHLEDSRPVSWIVDYVTKALGSANWSLDKGQHSHEAGLLRLDNTKATQFLGWQPRLPLSEALDWTVSWYESQRAGRSAHALCLQQVEDFIDKCSAGSCSHETPSATSQKG